MVIIMEVLKRKGMVYFWWFVSLILVRLYIRKVVGVSGLIGKLVVIWFSSVVWVIWMVGMFSMWLILVIIGSMLK